MVIIAARAGALAALLVLAACQPGTGTLTPPVSPLPAAGPPPAGPSAAQPPPAVALSALPPPRPADTAPYEVGAYYFPGWATRERWKVLDAFPERVPLLGYYREGDPAVMDWQLRWAAEHGISFFVFDWYWDRGRRQLEHALDDGYLRSPLRSLVKFCLLWANHNPPGSSSEADLLALLDHWIERYFHRPEYLTVDGRPLVIVFSSGRLREDLGSEGVRRALLAMRERARSRGLPGLYLAAVTGPGAGMTLRERLDAQVLEGYDATTGYNYPAAGLPAGARRGDYASAIPVYRAIWEEAGAARIPHIPVTEPGWDSRPWHGERALVRTGRHPARFREMLAAARDFVDGHPVAGRRLVLVEAWNEYGEGAAIEPHCEWGFGYLAAVRDIFAGPRPARAPLTPASLGLAVPQVDCPAGACPDPLRPCAPRPPA